jgi:predicted Zn-dependent protease
VKRALVFAVVLSVAVAALYFAQRRKQRDAVSPNAVVELVADWQHDLTRAPMRFTRISDDEEMRIGSELASQYGSSQEPESAEGKAFELYVNQIGERVAAHTKRRLAYRFHLLRRADFINAFALPGGQVFIGQGLVDQLTSEDELAFVLGHEIEHIDHYHAVERVQVEAQLKHLDLDMVAAAAQIPMSLWQAGYSKDEELEADREGLRIAVSAGYSAQGAVKLLEKWTRLHREYVIHAETPTEELSQVAVEGLTGYFRSHPLPSERLAQASNVIVEDHLAIDKPIRPFHVEYEVTSGAKQR